MSAPLEGIRVVELAGLAPGDSTDILQWLDPNTEVYSKVHSLVSYSPTSVLPCFALTEPSRRVKLRLQQTL